MKLTTLALATWLAGGALSAAVPAGRNEQAAAGGGLTIVVLEGEDAVNIIQQKTAVAPVVEVRDRNNQPVGGAVVTFAIRGGRATFNGARTLTMATNAAGRAVATGLTPTGSGALQIGASAAFQGQTAVATIVQTNVMTAAEAATAAGAGAGAGSSGAGGGAGAGGAGAAGGGGGLSATTLGIVGAAAAGGAVAAAKATGGDDSASGPGTGVYTGTANLTTVETVTSSGLLTAPGNVNGLCTFTVAISVTMTADLDEDSHGTVSSGHIDTNWTESLTGLSCGGTSRPGGAFGPDGNNVDGQPVSNLHFDTTITGTPPGGGSLTYTKNFTGALSGDTISGTYTVSRSQTGPGDARATFPPTTTTITLRRQ